MEKKVAVITGGNAGVGLSVADRLLEDYEDIHVCLACRNEERANNAKLRLLRRYPNAEISLIKVDTSSVASVLAACKEIQNRFSRLDYLFLNAGIMKVSKLNMSKLMGLFTRDALKILNTGHGVLVHEDNMTKEGLPEVFATNLFGHYVMVRELESQFEKTGTSIIVWTSSQNADKDALNFDDIQHRSGTEPYSSSKYAMDVLSVALNNKLNKKGIFSVTTCPGLVFSGMTFKILPEWVWMIISPFFFLMRLFVASLTISPHKGAEALVWVLKQKPESLNCRIKYRSNCSILGFTYIGEEKLSITDEDASNLYGQMEKLYQEFKTRYSDEAVHNGKHCNGTSSSNGTALAS